jgi:hypothetical protein
MVLFALHELLEGGFEDVERAHAAAITTPKARAVKRSQRPRGDPSPNGPIYY